jgi:hypothetical protein
MRLSFCTLQQFHHFIDALPHGPEWECAYYKVDGDVEGPDGNLKSEVVEVWRHNPVSCVEELISNPYFEKHLQYTPEKHFEDAAGTNQCYSEMNMGEWWWDLQVNSS